MFKIFLLAMMASSCLQASVIYSFTGQDGNTSAMLPVAFQLTVPGFVDPYPGTIVRFTPDLSVNLFTGGTPPVGLNITSPSGGSIVQIFLLDRNLVTDVWSFRSGALGAVGVYTADGVARNTGTLTVTQSPEPASVLLFLAGLSLCAFRRWWPAR